MRLSYLYKLMMIFQYVVKPVIGYKTKRYQAQCAAKYIELGMQARKLFICALSGFFLMNLAVVYSTVYFLVVFPNDSNYGSSIQFWVALLSIAAVVFASFIVCSQWFWLKLLRVNEILSYMELDTNNNS